MKYVKITFLLVGLLLTAPAFSKNLISVHGKLIDVNKITKIEEFTFSYPNSTEMRHWCVVTTTEGKFFVAKTPEQVKSTHLTKK